MYTLKCFSKLFRPLSFDFIILRQIELKFSEYILATIWIFIWVQNWVVYPQEITT